MSDDANHDDAPIACVDLNGVLDAYTDWKGADGDFDETPREIDAFAAHGESPSCAVSGPTA